ncbi:hypothetical protein C8R44DRAFT_324759 [Mycena epipterygia]|nr:hypothetical protein C8R44DRAFT_324759 [Mycena epipterygia]
MEGPELAQELVDHIIDFPYDSPNNWPACALVSRSWTHAAQSHIFRSVRLVSSRSEENERLWTRFHETLDASPHLIRHVRQLDFRSRFYLSTETFIMICSFPFTHLQRASVDCFLTPTSAVALQQMLSLPTLHHLQILCVTAAAQSAFFHIWDQCSTRLRHLELECYLKAAQGFSPTIRLESLNVIAATDVVRDWLTHPLCPLDFSGLKHFSTWNTELLASQKFAHALQTIQTLDVLANTVNPILDLSSFPSLALLRITIIEEHWSWVLATLSTITPSNRILKIVLAGGFLDMLSAQLDSQLSDLPISPTVELELDPFAYARIIPSLPLSSSRNMLRRVDEDASFFRRVTDIL